jgi:hypothetical protein
VKRKVKAVEWDHTPGMRQPEPAYLLNLEARINAVLRKGPHTITEKIGTTHDDA